MLPLLDPALYAETGTDVLPGAPALRAVRAPGGQISFPPQRYGCRVSGASGAELEDVLLTGRGRLRAFATVHIHPKPVPAVPFTIVEVALEDGPVVRGLLSATQALPIEHGAVLVTRLEETVDEAGQAVRALRFVAADPA
ncbi:hypothetical protein [Burkholderia lata]|uniref:DUF35 domain-containing protein n=1 Tax=Burkholderia lata (strain ATCC 17760 / DSM 23089 / LMG 22485 / NCIMB 9086 / R18194 / 383) TaxID=482957 RepID=Q39P22_BURL3|nr:hypothetical protein [Burkholderia lata]ABB05794.1 hypothetical protein Bcep18194_C6745 [Burkholderia lata]